MATKGVKNVMGSDAEKYITKFWALNKIAKRQKESNQVRTHEEMQVLSKLALENYEIIPGTKDYEYKNFILFWILILYINKVHRHSPDVSIPKKILAIWFKNNSCFNSLAKIPNFIMN